jgi:DNA-binding MarR family transcriptional regulator
MEKNLKPFIPSWLDEAGLTQAEFRLYCHLCRRADNVTGIAWPAYQSIQEACGFSHKTVWTILKKLVKRGLIVKVGKPFGGSCRYQILTSISANEIPIGAVPIVSSGESLEPSNSFATGTIDDSQSFPSGNSNHSPQETPIVSSGEREGNPLKEIHLRKSKREISPEGIQFAQWFKSSLPQSMNLKTNWQQSFAETYDELVRLDNRSPEQIREVSRWARTEPFWKSNFMSPSKLRKRNSDGITYFDIFTEKMKQSTHHTPKPTNTTTVNLGRRTSSNQNP